MPWQDKTGFGFHRAGIMKHSAEEGGVFGLFRDEGWVFIGYADNIQASLLALLTRPEFREEKPEGFVFEQWGPERSIRRRDELVLEYYPSLNLRVGGLPETPQEAPKETPQEDPRSED